MKNKTILSIVFILSCLDLTAQESSPMKNWRFGVMGGIQPYGKVFDLDVWKSTSGFVAGVTTQYNFTQSLIGFSILFQPHWNSLYKKDIRPLGFQGIDGEIKWCSQSINLPLLVRYTLGTGRVKPFVEIGPNVRFRTSFSIESKGQVCGFGGCNTFESDFDIHPYTTKSRLGLIAGIGMEVPLGKIILPITFRLNEGFGDEDMEGTFYDSPIYTGLKTRTFQIVTGISF